MDLDRTALNEQQVQLVDAWEDLFRSFGWKLIKRRFGPRMGGTLSDLENAENMREVGEAKGKRVFLRELLELERVIEAEFQHGAYQAVPQEGEE